MSQESLHVDKSQTLWEQNDRCGKRPVSHDPSVPIRSGSSAHNILAEVCSPTEHLEGSGPSAAGVWRTPRSQPIRIDVPPTRAMETQTNPQTASMKQSFQVNTKVPAPPNPDHHVGDCPVPANKKPPQTSFPSQQQRTTSEEGSTPAKHVSFQDPPAQQGTEVWRRWRREAQTELEKPKELCEVELLEQEVQRLRVKEERTLEENDRLRRLSLEWQFQKRLQEVQKKGNDHDEEEEDEDLDTWLMTQQLERQRQARGAHR